MTKKIDLSIIIVSFNSRFWLKTTLESLSKHYLKKTNRSVEVIVVDNGSSDESPAMVKKEFGWVRLITLETNSGFSAGNNVGLKEATGAHVMLLNSDVEWPAQSQFDEMLDFLESHKEVAVITPKLLLSNGKIDKACHRGEPTLWASFTYMSGLAKLFPQSKLFGQYHLSYENMSVEHAIAACSGASMVVKSSAIKKVGLLDEQFFFYAEDLDWCKRFRDAGYQIYFYPQATLIHHKYKSGISSNSSAIRRKTRAYFYDTMLQYYDKHYRVLYPEWVRIVVKGVITLKKGGI